MGLKPQPIRFIAKNFGPFDEIELNWDKRSQHTLIVGENGLGKSSLVAGLATAMSINNYNLSNLSQIAMQYVSKDFGYIYFEFSLGTEIGQTFTLLQKETNKNIQELAEKSLEEIDSIHDTPLIQYPISGVPSMAYCTRNIEHFRESLDSSEQVFFLPAAYGVNRQLPPNTVSSFSEIQSNPLSQLLNPLESQTGDLLQWIANLRIKSALAHSEGEIGEANEYLGKLDQIEGVFADLLKNEFKFKLERNPIGLAVQLNGQTIQIDKLSSGTMNLMSWILDYLMRADRVNWKNPLDAINPPGIVLIDEIDLHIHPAWQRRIIDVVSDLLPNTHLIATTHSPFVIGSADDTQVFWLHRDKNHQIKAKATYDEYYGTPADIVLQKEFVESLYPPQIEKKLDRLNELVSKEAFGTLDIKENKERKLLTQELSELSPWVKNLLSMIN